MVNTPAALGAWRRTIVCRRRRVDLGYVAQVLEAQVGHHERHGHATTDRGVGERDHQVGRRIQPTNPAGQVPEEVTRPSRARLGGGAHPCVDDIDARWCTIGEQQFNAVVGAGTQHEGSHHRPGHGFVAPQAGADGAGIEHDPH